MKLAIGIALLLTCGLGNVCGQSPDGSQKTEAAPQTDDLSKMDWIKIALSGVLGGLLASFFTHQLTRSRNQGELTTDIATQFLEHFKDMVDARSVLEHCATTASDEQVNLVARMGNWWEIVSTLEKNNRLDTSLFKALDLGKSRKTFKDAVNFASGQPKSKFAACSKDWPNLFSSTP